MSEFNTSKNKFEKIWNRIISNTSEKEIRYNSNNPQFFTNLLKQQNIKAPIEVYNSGDILLTTSQAGGLSAIKGTTHSSRASYSQSINIEIPEVFLPFVKYSVEVKAIPDTETHVLYQPEVSTWTGDNIKIEGDGKLIYKNDIEDISPGFISNANGSQTFSDSFFFSNNIDFDMSKIVWRAVINGSNQGNITRITTLKHTSPGVGFCSGVFNTETFNVNNLKTSSNKIINMTSTSFIAIGTLVVTTVTSNTETESCDIEQVVTEDVQKTITFASLENYAFTINDTLPTFKSPDITSQSFFRNNRWLYWSNSLLKLFVLEIKTALDGDKRQISLENLPTQDTDDPSSVSLPYTSITLKRNLDPKTPIPQIEKTLGIVKSNRFFKNYVKTSSSNANIPSYRFALEGEFFINSPAVELDSIIQFPVYNDIYTQVGSPIISYSLTTENHSFLDKQLWTSESQDVILNIKAYLVNPLYWREQRVYKNGL